MQGAPEVKVSVVVPVFNVERYLPRCLDGILGQTLKDIEIICVDDGSTDGSGAILDDYAKRDGRVRVVHQPNSGAGAARNAGLDRASGEYLFFFDPDDSCGGRMLEGMYSRARETDADIVIAGKATVDADTGKTLFQYGFHRDIWRFRQPFSSAEARDYILTLAKSVPWDKLFRREFILKNGLRFQNTRRSNDVFFVDMALVLAERIALKPRAYYRYSLNRDGSLQSDKDKYPLVFLDAYRALETELRTRGLFDAFAAGFARVFLNTALFNLQHLKEPQNISACYTAVRQTLLRLGKEVDLSHDSLVPLRRRVLHELIIGNEDFRVFVAAVKNWGMNKSIAGRYSDSSFSIRRLVRKYLPIPVREAIKRVRVLFLPKVSSIGRIQVEDAVKAIGSKKLDFIDITADKITLSISSLTVGLSASESLQLDASAPVEIRSGDEFSVRTGGTVACGLQGRRYSVVIDRSSLPMSFSCRQFGFGPYCGLVPKRDGAFFRRGGVLVCHRGARVFLAPDGLGERVAVMARYACRFFLNPHIAEWKAVLLRLCAWFVRKWNRRPIWLVSDRSDRADDNGRALFEYISALPRSEVPARCIFAIDRNCPDYEVMRGVGEVVDMSGWWYKVLFLASDFIISAYRTKAQRMPFGARTVDFLSGFFARRYRFVCLRHGISQNDQADDLGRHRLNARLLISATRLEYDSILGGRYGYGAREVKLCGMTRYDKLYDAPSGCITIMPTWRSYLTAGAGTNMLLSRETFAGSDFCLNYRGLLSDGEFIKACVAKGFRVRLMMHPNMRDSIGELNVSPLMEILPPETSYRDVFATSDLVVTDYSSVAFDFAYLKKPVVYFQFDREQFFGAQYKAGYFDVERDGFGEVETDLAALKRRVLEYAEGGCRMKDEYRDRVDRFFAYTDRNNCKRVYEAILKADAEDRARN